MSYTSLEQIKGHLVSMGPVAEKIHDQRLVMTGTEYLNFYGGAVDEASVTVKSPRSVDHVRETLTVGQTGAAFGNANVVFGSVTVASDSSLGQVYEENKDYIVNYSDGQMVLKEGGDIIPGQTLTVWHLPYTIYIAGIDYRVDYDRGAIARLSGGNLADGETVLLDYSPVYSSFNDEILTTAARCANGLIEREVDPNREFGADPVLAVAATYRALDIVCRTACARELTGFRGNDRVATAWMKLADNYSALADRLLKFFHPPYTGPSSPSI